MRARAALAAARAPALWLALGGLLATMAVLLWFVWYRPHWDAESLTWLALCAAALSTAILALTPGTSTLGFVGVYGLYLTLAHLGAAGTVLVSSRAFHDLRPWQVEWFYTPQRPVAVALSGLAVGAFVLGAVLFGAMSRRATGPTLRDGSWPGIYWVGMALLIFSAGYMVAAASGTLPILGSYAEYRRAAATAPLYSTMLFALATGLALAVATGNASQRRLAWVVFAVPAGLLAVAGNRGEILYPAAAAVAVYATRGYRFGLKALAGGAIVFFVFIPLAQQIRGTGVGEADIAASEIRWTDPFVTNGWTLRPLTFTVGWIDSGEEYAMGQTYLLPVKRIVGALTPFVARPRYEDSPYYLKDRLPGQGYSVIAEAYYNFGAPGVIVLLSALGAFLAFTGDRPKGGASLSFAAAVMAVLINGIRNHSVFLPGQIVMVTALWSLGLLLTALMRAWPGGVRARSAPAAARWTGRTSPGAVDSLRRS